MAFATLLILAVLNRRGFRMGGPFGPVRIER